MCMVGIAHAAPFLTVEPMTEVCGEEGQYPCPTYATCYDNDEILATEIPLDDNHVFRYDLKDVKPGKHEFKCIYHDPYGGISLQSNPIRLGPQRPTGLKVIP